VGTGNRGQPQLLAEQNAEAAEASARRYGWEQVTGDWADVAEVDIDLFVNAGPNHLHAEPSIAAALKGNTCSVKPLASSADEGLSPLEGRQTTGGAYVRFHASIPALNLAREMIRSGELGEIRHFRSRFCLTCWRAGRCPGASANRKQGWGPWVTWDRITSIKPDSWSARWCRLRR
jgi:predicted dehydrogenase